MSEVKFTKPGINFDEALKGGRIIVSVFVLVIRKLCDISQLSQLSSQQNINGHQRSLTCHSAQL